MRRHDESLMWQYAANELEPGEAKLVELHLEECPECQDRLQAVEFARETLTDAQGAVPPMAWAKVDERIGAVVERKLSQKARRRWVLGGALATAAVAAALLAAFSLPSRPAALDSPKPVVEPVLAVAAPPRAVVEHAEGLVLADGEQVLVDGARLRSGDVLKTALAGRAFLHLPDASHLRVGAATKLSLTRADREDVALTLERGRLAVKASHAQRRAFVVHSGGVTVNVVGTTFAVANGREGVEVAVSEGRVRVESETGASTFVEGGQRVLFDARTGLPRKLKLTPSVRAELAEVAAAADAVTALEQSAGGTSVGGVAQASDQARAGPLPRLDPREAAARQRALPPEALGAVDSAPKRSAAPPRTIEEPGTAFPSLAGGITVGLPPKWQEAIEAEEPAPAPAPIPGGPLTMVVPTLPAQSTSSAAEAGAEWAPPPEEKAASAASEWSAMPQAEQAAPQLETAPPRAPELVPSAPRPPPARQRAAGVARDMESIFLGRAEASLEKGTCERFLVGLEEIAMDAEKTERTEVARVLRARCYDMVLRPRQAMSEYRKYLAEYPVGQFTDEAREALGQ